MVSSIVNILGYKVSEELYNGSRTLVYRGFRETDSLPVVIKLLKNPYPSFSELLSFRNQYTIAKNLNSPLIIATYSLEPYQNGYALVMEDFGGISLNQWMGRKQQTLIEFLEIAIALCNTLDVLYRERIIHKDIKPANILINPETKQVKLIDFSIASLLPRETQTLINPNILEGTLAYISPEQTGRMNRGIDYRTDFYSLGVTFYELLTGQLPFHIKGKYDQFQRNIPFSAFVQAFRYLMGQLLTESDIQIQQWRNQILSAVGENGQVIIEVIPELSRIIGEQPAAAELSGTAAQNRFNLLFQKFTQVFTSAEHPLVMFLDDLQWADSASLKLMQLLMADTKHMLLIGAYRDNEVNPGHPLMLTLSEIQKTQATINTITLVTLSQVQVNQLVTDTLKCPETLAWSLSQLVSQKTQGNPFFATQFLKALHQENLIKFDFELGCWQCDMVQVIIQAVTDDVVAFMAAQLRKLPQSTQDILQLAACIGNQFDLATLAIVSQQSEIDTAANLWKALQSGLILPISDVYKFYQGESQQESALKSDNSRKQIAKYQFLHDRVQQAAYSLIPDDQKTVTHLQIGQLLREKFLEVEKEEKLFDIVNHLNIGKSLINQPSERTELAQLNLTAGRKAKYATAYSVAIAYFTIGIELLEQDSWESHYELTLALHEATAEVAYLSGQFAQIEAIATVTLKYGKTLLDKITTYDTQIQAYLAQNRLTESIQTALDVLKQLGIQFPKNPNRAQTLLALVKTKLILGRKKTSELWQLPTMSHPEKLAAMRILSSALSAAFIGVPKLYPLLIFQQVNLSVQYGNIPLSVVAYAAYGMILCGVLVDIDGGYEFGELALQILEKFNAKNIRSQTLFAVKCFISHWKQHLRAALPGLQEAYKVGLETGDVEFSAWAAVVRGGHLYWSGHELSDVGKTLYHYGEAITPSKQHNAFIYINIYRQVVLNLMSEAANPSILDGSVYSEAQNEIQAKAGDFTGVFIYHVNHSYLSYLFGEFSNAVKQATIAKKYAASGTSTILNVPFCFYDSLTRLALYPNATQPERSQILRHVSKNQKKMQKWASFAPMNTLHKFHLVEAERHRVLRQWTQAQEMYDCAISGTKANEYIQEEALANELAAKFYLDWGKEKIAQVYMQEAYYCYARWGAKAKVADLERRYPQLLAPILEQTRSSLSSKETIFTFWSITSTVSPTYSSINVSAALDLAAILKASQTLSGEIELEKLLASLLRIVIENAGADKCVLMLLRDERLLIKGSIIEGSEPVVLQRLPIESSQDIPLKLIYKVQHDRQTVVLIDATADPTLVNDPYIVRQQPKGILCSPILHQGKLLGILYLENNLVTGAFTSERVELLNLLCAQAAISLENARLYERSLENTQQLERSFAELQQKSEDLQQAQLQIVQSEKMSALGNLVAGVAHEMNNPLGFIAASLKLAKPTLDDLVEHLKLYQENLPNPADEITDHAESIDLDYSLKDLPKMIDSMSMACDRLENISTSLRTFSRTDKDYKVPFDIHQGIDSTILILKHRIKANEQRPAIEVITNYGNLPQVECFPGQLNQVFMNLIANAIDALDESNQGRSFAEIKDNPNRIIITTSVENTSVKIAIADNGKGMNESVKSKIFDHLFTTKAVGKGTGLGLAIARQIVEETHGGKLSFNSVLSEGTEFIIGIPV